MKKRLAAALDLLKSAETDIRPGGRGEIDFKQALVEVQGAIDMPDQEPVIVTNTQIMTGEMAEQVGAKVMAYFKKMESGLEELSVRLAGVETAVERTMTVSQACSEKLDGMEDALALVLHYTTPEPTAAVAP